MSTTTSHEVIINEQIITINQLKESVIVTKYYQNYITPKISTIKIITTQSVITSNMVTEHVQIEVHYYKIT